MKVLEENASKNKRSDNSSVDEVEKLKEEAQRAKEFCDTYEIKKNYQTKGGTQKRSQ